MNIYTIEYFNPVEYKWMQSCVAADTEGDALAVLKEKMDHHLDTRRGCEILHTIHLYAGLIFDTKESP